jgi:hypothetical protein
MRSGYAARPRGPRRCWRQPASAPAASTSACTGPPTSSRAGSLPKAKVYLLYRDRDFDFGADLPPGHADLIQDLELTTLLQAMAAGEKFLFEVSVKVLLAGLNDPEAIRYRQRVLTDCLAQPEVIREMYAVAAGAVEDKRPLWYYGSKYQSPSSNLSGAVAHLEAFVARLRQLRKIADDNIWKVRSDGMRTLFATLQRELDDEYFDEISFHLKQLRFRAGVLISAELEQDNSGIGFVLRTPGRRSDPGGPHQPGNQPGRQRGGPVGRPYRQLLHYAARRGPGVLRQPPVRLRRKLSPPAGHLHPLPQGRAPARRAPQLQARRQSAASDQLRRGPVLPARCLAG